jgi:hypothetical protein
MRSRISRDALIALLGDADLYRLLLEAELIPEDEEALGPEDLVTARVTGTLVHELEVNWAGVEVILRLRARLWATQRELAELLRTMPRPADEPDEPAE